jgi:hypothetical protein
MLRFGCRIIKQPKGCFPIQRIISANISEDMHASLTLARPTVIPMIRKSPSCQSAWPSTAWPEGPTVPVTQHPKVLPAASAVPRPPCYPEASQRPCLNLAIRPKSLLAIRPFAGRSDPKVTSKASDRETPSIPSTRK